MYQGSVLQFKSFSQFSSLRDFNNNIEQWMIDIKNQFTKKELILLKRLIRYSAKVYGISNVSINKLLASVQQYDNITVSEATFHRMKRKAIKLGLLTVHTTKRSNMSQSSNVWVFNSYVSKTNNDTPSESISKSESVSRKQSVKDEMTSLKAVNTLKSSNKKERKSSKQGFNKEYVSGNIPEAFTETVGVFFNADYIYKFWDRLNLALRNTNQSDSLLVKLDDYIKVFKESVYRLKQGKIRGSFTGYLYSSWAKFARHMNMRNNARKMKQGLYFNWLEE